MKAKMTRTLCIILFITFCFPSMLIPVEASEPESYTIESAVRTGLNNSRLLQQLDNKVTLSELKYDAYKKIAERISDGKSDLSSASSKIDDALSTINSSQDKLNQAKLEILNGIYPQGFPDVTIVPNALIIKGGDDIAQKLNDFNKATNAGLDVEGIVSKITKQVNTEITKNQKTLDKGKVDYEKNNSYLVNGKIDYEIAKASISSTLAEKLDMSELKSLSTNSQKSLLLKLADASAKITAASKGIYRNQIALLIQNSYYNALKSKKIMEVKESTMKRAETQYKMAKDGYEAGMKAKDDMLFANIFYTGTKLEYQKAVDDYNNALIELKKNMNIPMDKTIILKDVLEDKKTGNGLGYRVKKRTGKTIGNN